MQHRKRSRSPLLHACMLALLAGAAGTAAPTKAEGERFEGRFFRGEGDVEYLKLLDIARRMFDADPEFQNLPMLYTPQWNGLVEGPTWGAWWIQNSYGTTYCGLPFYLEPTITFLGNAHDCWFNQMGDGKKTWKWNGVDHGVVPDGQLCDAASDTSIIFKQGDGRVAIHDWGVEFTAAGVLMQAELLLIGRDARAIAHYLPLLERSANFLETRRDPANNLFLAGPAGNLLAPSYAGWKKPDGTYGQAYLAGLSITYIAALDRLIELEKLAGNADKVTLYERRRDLARAGLPLLATEEGYFVKYIDPDGTRHGVFGAPRHGYFEASPNHDAICFRVADDAQARKILDTIASIPGLRPHHVILPNCPSLDDMYESPQGLWGFGTWVNGGHWSTCEARMVMAYYRLGRHDDARRSMEHMLAFARQFRMDNPLVAFGSAVYQPHEPINLCYDSFGPPAALIRGLFEYLYRADGLKLIPHVPPSIARLEQRFPIRFGTKKLYLATAGSGPITGVLINGSPFTSFEADSVLLPYERVPERAAIQILLGGAKPFEFAAPPDDSRALPSPPSQEDIASLDRWFPNITPTTLPLRIGADSNGESRFLGDIDRASIVSRALSAAEIAALAQAGPAAPRSDPALIADYTFDDGVPGKPVGEVAVVDAPGGKAIRLAGKGFVEIPHDPRFDLTTEVTLDAWIRPEKMPQGGGRIIDTTPVGTSNGYLLDTHPANSLRLIVEIDSRSFDAKLEPGAWVHVAGTADREGRIMLYVNGKPVLDPKAAPSTHGSTLARAVAKARELHDRLVAAGRGDSYEAAHARLAVEYLATAIARRKLEQSGRLKPLEARSQLAADKSYLATVSRLCEGLARAIDTPRPSSSIPWHHPLYLAGDGYWRKRIPIAIENQMQRDAAGDPVTIRIGRAAGEADLEGAAAESIRLCNGEGVELLFAVTNDRGEPIRRGPIPAGARLTVPVESRAGSSTTYSLYFDNPRAWAVPDFLSAAGDLVNGGVEIGAGDAPAGWRHDPADDAHRTSWVAEQPHGGARCLKTVVLAGAEPTWIATRQQGISIIGGAEYAMRAWVKARDVEGSAGWYIHVGDAATPLMIAPMLSGGGGTYDWKEVSATFRAPEGAAVASLGTVLRGTGTAWFDDVTLECTARALLTARAGPVETLDLRPVDGGVRGAPSPDGLQVSVPLTVLNFSEGALENQLVRADLSTIRTRARLRGKAADLRIAGGDDGRAYQLGDFALVACDVPPRSALTVRLLLEHGGEKAAAVALRAAHEKLLASAHNLARDPSFESRDADTAERRVWDRSGAPAGASIESAEGGLFGKRAGRIRFPDRLEKAWTGWRQDIPIEPGGTYLYAAWVRTEEVRGGDIQIHAHFRTKDGALSQGQAMVGAGPALTGTTDWTLLSGCFMAPPGAAVFQIHLTMLASGTVWHDGVLVARVAPGALGALATAGDPPPAGELAVWQINSIVKVFRDDLPPSRPAKPAISLARNEKEPLQLAVRSGQGIKDMKVEVEPPADKQGRKLSDIAVGIVGYVPIDHTTNYYRSDSPAWHRKFPQSDGGCDGWPGWWPDPILPKATFDLAPGSTQPVWVTVGAPIDAPTGDYEGVVRLSAAGKSVKEIPYAVHVWGFSLPERSHVGAIYDVRLSGPWEEPGKSRAEIRKRFWRFMAERRLCADRIQPDPVLRWKEGRVVADFSEYDEAGELFFNELRFPFSYTPHVFYLFGWGHPPGDKFGEKPYEGAYPYASADRTNLRPAFKKAYQACLATYWNHLKEKGWDKRCVLYISDEPFDGEKPIRDQMKALCDMIHEVDPAIPIYSSTWHHQPEWNSSLDVWGIGHYGVVSPRVLEEIRKRGSRLWFTTDGHMCTDTPLCAIERLLPHYCFKFGVEAYEFWGIDWLTYNPFDFGWHSYIHQSEAPGSSTWVRYPNGDGYLAYPGKLIGHDGAITSIRLEQAREGVEDFEYLYLLRELLARGRAAGPAATAGAATASAAAESAAALEEAARLVSIPNPGGRHSSRILPEPDSLFAARARVASAIEKMVEARR